MEKQPVDDFFARKLRDAEVPISAELFGQLQQRMGTKPLPVGRRRAGAWWYVMAAASVVLVIVLSYPAQKTDYVSSKSRNDKRVSRAINLSKEAIRPIAAAPDRAKQRSDVGFIDEVINKQVVLRKVTYPTAKSIAEESSSLTERSMLLATQKPVEQIAEARSKETPLMPVGQVVAMTSVVAERIDQVGTLSKQPTERIIVLTIKEPQPETGTGVSTEEADADVIDQNAKRQAGSLSGLFSKIKQLKNGEVQAKSEPVATSQRGQKNKFGRVFARVKETLKNETTLE